jgi:hypothetical protein
MVLRSLTFLFFCITLILDGYGIVSAAPQTYEAYQTEVNNYCNSSGQLWGKYNTLVPKIDYSELSTNAINNTLSNWRAGRI